MDSTGGEEATTHCEKIDIKEEPKVEIPEDHSAHEPVQKETLTDPYQRPFEESDHIYVKVENRLEIPEDQCILESVQIKKEPCSSTKDTTIRNPTKRVKREEDDHCLEKNEEGDCLWRKCRREVRREQRRRRRKRRRVYGKCDTIVLSLEADHHSTSPQDQLAANH